MEGSGVIQRFVAPYKTEDFVNMLDDPFLPSAWKRFGMGPVSFFHERETFPQFQLTSPAVREWFQEHEEFKPELWPRKSWDLNPFKTIWYDFTQSIRLQRLQPQTEDELWEGVQELWGYRGERPLYWKGLVDSLKVNMNTVCELKGEELPI